MHRFDYSFIRESIPGSLSGLVGIIYDLRGRGEIRKTENQRVFEGLRQAAMVDSVRSSNAIEGIVTTAERAKALVRQDAVPVNHDEQEILGYRNALAEIYAGFERMELSEELVKHFHQRMEQNAAADAGEFKRENNWIQERSAEGKIQVRFVPVSAKDTGEAVAQWVMAYREARQDSRINGLLLTACVIVDFLCIHPFRDGNGRVSRLLTSLLLLKEGFDIGRYVSVEKKINDYKYGYYEALKASSAGWHENRNSYEPFITFLLQILYACYKEMDEKFIAGTARTQSKSRLVENTLLQCFVPVSKGEIAARLPEISVTTIERVLGQMVKDGRIVKIGENRGARYMRNSDR